MNKKFDIDQDEACKGMTEKGMPTHLSADGANTYLVPCESYNSHRHYAVCQGIIRDYESGDGRSTEPTCNRSIENGNCPSKDMMDLEAKAGIALFYIPRDMEHSVGGIRRTKQDITSTGYQRGWNNAMFDKIRRYLWGAGKDAKPVIGTTENFTEADPEEIREPIGMVAKTKAAPMASTPEPSMEEVMAGPAPAGHAELVTKIMEEEV